MSLVSPALVGRRAELAVLGSAVAAAREGRGASVFVLGEPGIGKSRLAAEAAQAATAPGMVEGTRVLYGRAAHRGCAVPLRPLSEAVFSALRGEGSPDLADLGPYGPVLARLGSPGRPNDEQIGFGDPVVLYAEAILRFLVDLGRTGMCLLVLEDLHDADADTLAIIDYLVDNLAATPVLLVATLRSEPGPAFALAQAATARRAARTLRLTRLDAGHTAELVARCLDVHTADIPSAVLDRLHAAAEGVPFFVEELLGAMVDSGVLARQPANGGSRGGWVVNGPLSAGGVPATVADAVLQRVDRLDPAAVALLEAGAVIGRRFPVDVAARAAGLPTDAAFHYLRTAARAHLIAADAADPPGWQGFRHALTADAILERLLPAERTALCGSAADTVEELYGPGGPHGTDGGPHGTDGPDGGDANGAAEGDRLAAELRAAAGQYGRAAVLFTRAGRQARLRGVLMASVELLDRGLALADRPDVAPDVLAGVLEELIHALVLAGDVRRVPGLGERLEGALTACGAPVSRRITAHLAQARAAAGAGRWDDGLAEVTAARDLLGRAPDSAATARADAVAAFLLLGSLRADRLEAAAALARAAVAAAEEAGLPEVACEALEVLGRCARRHDLAEAERIFTRLLATAQTGRLPVWRVRGMVELGVLRKLRAMNTDRLLAARKVAESTGAVVAGAWVELHLAMTHILRDEFTQATACADRCTESARHLRLRELELLAVGARAGAAAAQGHREQMEQALSLLPAAAVLGYGAEVWGWCRATCSLLEEDHDRAVTEFDQAARADRAAPTTRGSGYQGPYLLLRTVRGESGWGETDAFTDSALAQALGHQPYLAWSRAVLLGRDGRRTEAAKAAEEGRAVSGPMPLAHHLCLRLGAEAAIADGWGDPVGWLRTAEEFFHDRDNVRVAAACRALLRRAGAPPPRRRRDRDAVPGDLRRAGVTVREYEILRLLADRLGNLEIAERLFLSPRTVEKHVASLRARTGHTDRTELINFARGRIGPR